MQTNTFNRIVAMALAAAIGLMTVVAVAQRRESRVPQIPDQLALARICANEEGISRVTDGCAAIYTVIRARAERNHRSWIAQAYLYSRTVFSTRWDQRRWVNGLQPDGSEPIGWPTEASRLVAREDGTEVRETIRHAPWSSPDRPDDFRRRWMRLYEHAGQIVSGAVEHSCELSGRSVTPMQWGCPPDSRSQCRDHERAERAGWVRLECGDTARNWFYCDPRASTSCRRSRES